MTQYLLTVWEPRGEQPPGDEMDAIMADVDAVNDRLREAGAWVFAGGLHPDSTATVVRGGPGGATVTDGPYAETKEQLGGFWIIEVADHEAALAWAREATAACRLPIEVRAFQAEPPAA